MMGDVILAVWSIAGLSWWLIAWYLVATHRQAPTGAMAVCKSHSLSIFKPLPLLGTKGLKVEAIGLESFFSQMDENTELLLGAHEADRGAVTTFVESMRQKYSAIRLQVIFRISNNDEGNPKIAWQKILATHATGDLWLWSDADVLVPFDFLQRALAEFSRRKARLLTFPYAVSRIPACPALFDALFVNVEFLPGVLLLSRFGSVDFGLGAAMLFRREDFLRLTDWKRLESSLADDFVLGQLLQPVCISSVIITTAPEAGNWKTAIEHYLRWVKTIRWCRPGGYAAQIIILPTLGWLFFVCFHPATWWAWVGLMVMMQLDVFFAWMICRYVGCTLYLRYGFMVEIWSLFRALSWLLCWLPFPVFWRTKPWWSPQLKLEGMP
jgi:ceramide glucosyltransferase